jgi:uncharacterized membrane protein (UPF0127 family)
MKKLILLTCAVFILTACSSKIEGQTAENQSEFLKPEVAKTTKSVTINDHTWTVETVSTPEALEQGLSNRESLPADNGMYFVFDDLTERTFWMKNMKFPLDIIFIKDDEIVTVSYDAMPEGSDPQNFYYSKEPVNRVLEINNGDAMKYNLKAGDKVKFND